MYSFLWDDEAIVYVCMCPRFNNSFSPNWQEGSKGWLLPFLTGFEEDIIPPLLGSFPTSFFGF
jgi:hypothetical protein